VRTRAGAALLAALLVATGCRKGDAPRSAAAPRLPKGDVVWLTDPQAAQDPALDGELGRLGAVAVFLPGGTLGAAAGPESLEMAPPPPKPLEQAPVVLVLRPSETLVAALTTADGPSEALAVSAAATLSSSIAGGRLGRVAGVHLDFPFAPQAASRYAAFVVALRRGLPHGMFVSITLRTLPSAEEDRKRFVALLEAADALVAIVFGPEPRVDPTATDALRRPWWAAYDTRAVGEIQGPGGVARGPLPARLVEPLSGNGRFQFENDLSVNDGSVSAFTLTARAPVRLGGLEFSPGDRIAFRLPAIPEMLFQLGSNLAGKRYALGRAMIFDGASEAERVFDLAALEDIVLGRSLAPVLEASVKPAGKGAVAVELVNQSHHASVISRVDNWVEVDLFPAHPADVQIGGFDRYEVYDRAGQAVTPGRATVVRFFETLIAPLEHVTPARILLRGPLPPGCCRFRMHAISAAGPEVATDWSAPAPPPEPTKPPPRKKRT
jgi:hypothetical protein